MYSYYAIAAMGPAYQKYLWWKKYLTVFQMVRYAVQICWDCGSEMLLGLTLWCVHPGTPG